MVVNDLGGSRDGGGSSTKVADTVVDEIRRAGNHKIRIFLGEYAEELIDLKILKQVERQLPTTTMS